MRQAVIFIHGTGAGADADEGEKWWQRNSAFHRALGDALGSDFACCEPQVFHWTGANSERDRQLAGTHLLAVMAKLEDEGTPYHLIGHSHGGNVIWNALREAAARRRPLLWLRSWATVGTPFLHFRRTGASLWFIPPIAVGAALLWAAAPDLRLIWDAGWRDGWRFAAAYVATLSLLLAAAAVVVASVLHFSFGILSKALGRGDQRAKGRAFRRYGGSWLGVWSDQDEAINGLKQTLGLGGAITPRLQPKEERTATGHVGWVLTLPVRVVQNRLLAPMADEFIWDRLTKSLQGIDRPRRVLLDVTAGPVPRTLLWPALPGPIDQALVDRANRCASDTLGKLRSVLGVTAQPTPRLPRFVAGIGQQFEWGELVHTSYFDSPKIVDLLREHITSHAHPAAAGEARVAAEGGPVTPAPDDEIAQWRAQGTEYLRNAVEDCTLASWGWREGSYSQVPVTSAVRRPWRKHAAVSLSACVLVCSAWAGGVAVARREIHVHSPTYQIAAIFRDLEEHKVVSRAISSESFDGVYAWMRVTTRPGFDDVTSPYDDLKYDNHRHDRVRWTLERKKPVWYWRGDQEILEMRPAVEGLTRVRLYMPLARDLCSAGQPQEAVKLFENENFIALEPDGFRVIDAAVSDTQWGSAEAKASFLRRVIPPSPGRHEALSPQDWVDGADRAAKDHFRGDPPGMQTWVAAQWERFKNGTGADRHPRSGGEATCSEADVYPLRHATTEHLALAAVLLTKHGLDADADRVLAKLFEPPRSSPETREADIAARMSLLAKYWPAAGEWGRDKPVWNDLLKKARSLESRGARAEALAAVAGLGKLKWGDEESRQICAAARDAADGETDPRQQASAMLAVAERFEQLNAPEDARAAAVAAHEAAGWVGGPAAPPGEAPRGGRPSADDDHWPATKWHIRFSARLSGTLRRLEFHERARSVITAVVGTHVPRIPTLSPFDTPLLDPHDDEALEDDTLRLLDEALKVGNVDDALTILGRVVGACRHPRRILGGVRDTLLAAAAVGWEQEKRAAGLGGYRLQGTLRAHIESELAVIMWAAGRVEDGDSYIDGALRTASYARDEKEHSQICAIVADAYVRGGRYADAMRVCARCMAADRLAVYAALTSKYLDEYTHLPAGTRSGGWQDW